MTPEELINGAVERGMTSGLAALNPLERLVFLVSEAEIDCDMNGIDTLLDRYSPEGIAEIAAVFMEVGATEISTALARIAAQLPQRSEPLLAQAHALITNRCGYDYESVLAVVKRRMSDTATDQKVT